MYSSCYKYFLYYLLFKLQAPEPALMEKPAEVESCKLSLEKHEDLESCELSLETPKELESCQLLLEKPEDIQSCELSLEKILKSLSLASSPWRSLKRKVMLAFSQETCRSQIMSTLPRKS